MRKGYSILITSTDSGGSKHLFLSKKLFAALFALLIIIIVVIIINIISYSRIYYRAMEAEALRRRNAQIEEEFTKLKRIEEYLTIAEMDNQKIKIMLGIEKSPTPVEPIAYEESPDLSNNIDRYIENDDNIPSLLPAIGHISKNFGPGHEAIDIAAPRLSPVIATASGMVIDVGWDSLYGNYVIIEHNRNYSTFYGHLYSIDIRNSQKVTGGEIIGTVGSSGKSTSPHLHYEVRFRDKKVDPTAYIPFYTKI
jgi:murein DD-endopeptidase MepM/ murein hydrolase activator NlpD